eukprot:10210858-Karenia_brevis.AAC.1
MCIRDSFRRIGLVVHEIEPPSTTAQFVGIEFESGEIRVKKKRVWRLRWSIEEILLRKHISGQALEIILGHATWLMLVR